MIDPLHTAQLAAHAPAEGLAYARSVSGLQPKGTCWYCDQAVDSVRRFCCPECRNDYLEEESGFGKL